jgi:hypothetical protein
MLDRSFCGAGTSACSAGAQADARGRSGQETRRDESRRCTHECVRHSGAILLLLAVEELTCDHLGK